jgi:hypothetical protein
MNESWRAVDGEGSPERAGVSLNYNPDIKVLLKPFIKFQRCRVTLATPCGASGFSGDSADPALVDPLLQHSSKCIGVGIKAIGQIDQRYSSVPLDILSEFG